MSDPIVGEVADAVIPILTPVAIAWARAIIAKGQDPAVQLKLLLDSADAVADAAETVKFGP